MYIFIEGIKKRHSKMRVKTLPTVVVMEYSSWDVKKAIENLCVTGTFQNRAKYRSSARV
jgi:hypothetical protein